MSKPKSGTNPFYVLLVIVGMVFVIHVFAYSLMTYQTTQPTAATAGLHTGHPLWQFLDTYGDRMLWIELAALAMLTIGAIGTDTFWSRRGQENIPREETGQTP